MNKAKEIAEKPCPPLQRTIVLVGLMGAGKTSIGIRLAAIMGADFCDSDVEIEAAAGQSIADIFAQFGEPAFRAGERRVIARLLGGRPMVLATGGGAFMDPETRALIARQGVSVWLRADLDVLVARTSGRKCRPLLAQGDPRKTLADLMKQRYPVYAQADVVVDSVDGQTHDAMASRILSALIAHDRKSARGIFKWAQ